LPYSWSAVERHRIAPTRRRLARYRLGADGRIAHLKRGYHAGRARLRGATGAAIWTNWTVLDCNVETAAALPPRRSGRARARAPAS